VQVVDVLRDHARHLAGAIEARQRPMAAAGFGAAELVHHGEAPLPGFVACLLARQKFVELNRPVLGPQPAGRAEVRDAAFGRDAGAGEWYDGASLVYHLAEPRDRGGKIGSDPGG
jgi:hypothetical protein